MRACVFLGILGILTLAESAVSCNYFCNRLIRTFGITAVMLESSSVGLAYWARSEVSQEDDKNIYQAQAIGFGMGAGALLLAMTCADRSGLNKGFGSAAILAAGFGVGIAIWEHLKIQLPTTVTRMAFYSGFLGFASHAVSMVLFMLQRTVDPVEDPGLLA